LQQLPASPDAFVWLRLYQAQMQGLVPGGRDDSLWWTLRRPFRPLGYDAARAMFNRVNQALGSNHSLHDLRHTAAYRMTRDPGLPLTDVQWIIGDAHPSTTQQYLNPVPADVIASVLAFHARGASDPPPRGGAAGDAASQDREQILPRLSHPPFALSNPASQRYRMRGTACIPGWLADQPGSTWQQRGAVAEARLDPETDWRLTVSAWLRQRWLISPCRRREQQVVGGGLLPLVCGDVVRPGLRWLLSVRTLRDLAAEMARIRDPGGFAVLAAVCQSDSTSPEMRAAALRQI